MYRLLDHWEMITEPVRRDAYVRALRSAIRPGDTVTEIGTGAGYFAVIACKAGAARVHGIERDPFVHVAAELARANGCADRISLVQASSTSVSLPLADVLVSDLRGALPLWSTHIPSIIDARRRLLKPGGIQIPERDTMSLALAWGPRVVANEEADPHGVDLTVFERPLTNTWRKHRIGTAVPISSPAVWQTIDYRTVETPDCAGTVELEVEREGTANGLSVWFDTELHDGLGFSNGPNAPGAGVYGQAFFPLGRPLTLARGDKVRVSLRAKLVGSQYVWSWRGEVLSGTERGRDFDHSTFYDSILDPTALRKRAATFVPRLGRNGEAQAFVLSLMSGGASLGDIAAEAMKIFPDVVRDARGALVFVADLSQLLSE